MICFYVNHYDLKGRLESHNIEAFPRCGNNKTEISETLKLAANRNFLKLWFYIHSENALKVLSLPLLVKVWKVLRHE